MVSWSTAYMRAIGVLASIAIWMVSQATRLDKGSSITVQDKYVPLGSNHSESTLE